MGSVTYTQRAWGVGLLQLEMTPGGVCKPGPRSNASIAAAIAWAVVLGFCATEIPRRILFVAFIDDRWVGR